MRDTAIPGSVSDVDDKGLWSAMRVLSRRPGADLLAEAIDAGRAGRKAQAFRKLAGYHRRALAGEWRRIEAGAKAAETPGERKLRDLLNYKITAPHGHVIRFKDGIDWFEDEVPWVSLGVPLHNFYWWRPVVAAFIRTGADRFRRYLIDNVTRYFRLRRDRRYRGRYARLAHNQLFVAHKFDSWLPAYLALIHSGELPTVAAEAFMKHFLGFGRALVLCNRRFVESNVQACGCAALLKLARVLPEFSESPGWGRFAAKRIYEQVAKGYFPDGCHRERVWGYGYGTLRHIRGAYDAAQQYGGLGKYDRPVLLGIRRAFRFFAKTLGPPPRFLTPTYGDAGHNELGNAFKIGRRYFGRSVGECLGVDRTRSYLFKDSGFAVMRNGDDEDSAFITISFGPHGGWHAHQDLLSMNLWAGGEMLLEELCRFGPYATPLDFMFRGPRSHNLLTIDGMVYDCRHLRGEDVAWHTTDQADYFTATHWAYHFHVFGRRGASPVSPNIEGKVRRTVVFVKDPGYALVVDSVRDRFKPEGFTRAVTQHWHSPHPFRVVGPGIVRTAGRAGCILAYARTAGLVRLETGCDFTRQEGAPFGRSYDRHRLRARRWMPLEFTGNVGFATLLYPFVGRPPEVSLRPLDDETARMWHAEAYEVRTPRGKDLIVINPQRLPGVRVDAKPFACRALIRLAGRRGTVTVP